ncbi:sugar ABC transporter permease [Streptomyces carminius]|nr:sugar ABC transporter permease [Streptomyces carminius]
MSETNLSKTSSEAADAARADSPADTTPAGGNSAATRGATTALDPRLLVREQGLAGYWTDFKRKMRTGELGSVPVVVGLIVIWAIFQSMDSAFLSAENLSNLSVYIVGTGLISVGIVFVLLLGEIDLSVGSVSGLASAVFAVLAVNNGMNEWLALVLALLTGAAVGAFHGFFFAKIGVPAFVVTLAGLLAWNGLMLKVLGTTGTINLDSEGLVANFSNHYFNDVAVAYGTAVVAVAVFFVVQYLGARRRSAAGIPFRPMTEIVVRTAVLAVLAFGAAYMLNQYRGMPLALLLFLVVLVSMDFVVRRTSYGRKVFALGGNTEAARRAGINVEFVRITVFSIAGAMAAFGGLLIASRIMAANQGAGSGNLLMEAIAAAVIGGTSLFGGRGSVWSALLGMLVIGSIANGMALLGIAASVQYMITGAVLLAAVVIDSVSRRTQRSAGRT